MQVVFQCQDISPQHTKSCNVFLTPCYVIIGLLDFGGADEPQDISIRKCKIMIWKAVKDILEIAGYDIAAVEQEVILDSKDGHKAEPLL